MPNFRELNYVKKQHAEKNITLTFHGTESVWSSIIYPYDGNFLERITKFLYRITIDLHKRRVLKDFILTYRPKLIFVSKSWRKYTLDIINIKKVPYKIIYNPIDKELFRFRQRNGSLKRIICMRSHDTRKYALDIIIKMFRNSKYRIDTYGCGRLLPYHKRLAKRYNSNVKFIEKFYMHKQLGELYREYDLGVMLTRLDAQGVSACEMMQTGLPIITSDIFGNKEFTEKGCIRIPNDTKIRIDDVLERLNKRSVMMKLSREAHEYMDNKLDTKKIIEAELECLKK
jgi:glycosyltransferase involved in cell wall biosynthesis